MSELAGGILILFGAWQLARDPAGHLHIVAPLFALGAAAFSAWAGRLLMLERPSGIVLSLFVQGLQIVSVSGAWRYVLLAGPKLGVVIASAGLRFVAGGGGAFILSSAPPDGTLNAPGLALAFNMSIGGDFERATWSLGINLVAAYFFVRLWRLDSALTAQAERDKRRDQATALPDATAGVSTRRATDA